MRFVYLFFLICFLETFLTWLFPVLKADMLTLHWSTLPVILVAMVILVVFEFVRERYYGHNISEKE